jgi:transposase
MDEGYAHAENEVLPQAKVVADRFHVAKADRAAGGRPAQERAERAQSGAQERRVRRLHRHHVDGCAARAQI